MSATILASSSVRPKISLLCSSSSPLIYSSQKCAGPSRPPGAQRARPGDPRPGRRGAEGEGAVRCAPQGEPIPAIPDDPESVALAVAGFALGCARTAYARTTCAVTGGAAAAGGKHVVISDQGFHLLTPDPASCFQVTVAKAEKAAAGAAAAAGSLSALAALAGPASAAQARRRAP